MHLQIHKRHLAAVFTLSLLATLVFFAGLQSPFLYDDFHAIVENRYIKDLSQFQSLVGIENIFNRSVLLLTFAVNYSLGEQSVFGYHLINTVLHLLSAIVFYFIAIELLQLESDDKHSCLKNLPLFASALQAVNPVAVETSLYLSNRSTLLASFFFLLTFYMALLYFKEKHIGPLKEWLYYLAMFVCFFLGLGAKETVLTLPLVVGSFLWIKTSPDDRKRIVTPLIYAGALIGGYLALRYIRQGALFTATADPASAELNRWLYLFTQVKVWVSYYLNKLLLPINLNFEPDIALAKDFSDIGSCISIVTVLCLGALLINQSSRLAKFSALWTLIAILPTSSIVPLNQIAVEHRSYSSSFGVSLLLALACLSFIPKFRFKSMAFVSILILFSSLTVKRTLDYKSRVHIWEDTALKSPLKPLAHNNLATAYLAEKKYEQAKKELATVIKLDPLYSTAYINLGHILIREKKPKEALPYFERAIELGSERPEAFYNSGLVRLQMGQAQKAIPFLVKAVGLKPHSEAYRFQLGNAYRAAKKYDNAILQYRVLVRRNPKHIEARNNIGVVFWNLKDYPIAEREFLKALKINESYPEVHSNLASLYLASNRPEKAVLHLRRLAELTPLSPRLIELMSHYERLTKNLRKNRSASAEK